MRATRSDAPRQPSIVSGVAAGVLAGVAMMLAAMMVTTAQGLGPFHAAQLVAAAAWDGATDAGAGAALLGLGIHLVVAGALGAVFALGATHLSTPVGIGAGLLYGSLIWAVITWTILPWVDPPLYDAIEGTPAGWLGLHLAYGAIVGFEPVFARSRPPRFGRRAPVPA